MPKFPDPKDLPGPTIHVYTDVPYEDALFEITDPNGDRLDPSGWPLLELTIVNNDGHTRAVEATFTQSGGGLYVDGDDIINIDWSDQDTDDFDPSSEYEYFLRVNDGAFDPEFTHGGSMEVHNVIP